MKPSLVPKASTIDVGGEAADVVGEIAGVELLQQLHGRAGIADAEIGDAVAFAADLDASDGDRGIVERADLDLAERFAVVRVSLERHLVIDAAVEVDLAGGFAVEQHLGLAAVGLIEERNLGIVIGADRRAI